MTNRETASKAGKLYEELAHVDSLLKAAQEKSPWGKSPLQKVMFYRISSTYSGPQEYQPQYLADAVMGCVVADLRIQRAVLVNKLTALGFEAAAEEIAK